MKYSKIKSTVIYFKCLSDLHLLGFIHYFPAKNASKTTMVSIIILSISNEHTRLKNDEASNNFQLNSNQPHNGTESNNLPTHKTGESKYIQADNYPNDINNKHQFSDNVTNSSIQELFAKSKNNQEKKHYTILSFNSLNKSNKNDNKRITSVSENKIPEITDVISFFQENGSIEIEAKKFFYYYDSKAWLIGKNIKMVNWQSGAMKWILSNINTVNTESRKEPSNDKDYDIPL